MVGVRVKPKDDLNSVYICPQCFLVLRDPVQLIDCGHRICQSCADDQEGTMIICAECREQTPREKVKVDRGFRNEMQTLLIVCILCQWSDLLKNYQSHLNDAHPNPSCIYCEAKFSSINDLNRHQIFDCEKIIVECSLKQYGCEETILRIHLNEHYRSEQHQIIIMKIVRQLKSIDHPMITGVQYEEVVAMLSTLLDGVATLSDDRQRLSRESISYQTILDRLTQDSSTLKLSIQEQNTIVNDISTNQEALQRELESMKQKVIHMTTRSYDGIFIWKISDIQTKLVDARSENQTSIYSSPFYSSSTGYKMCLRLYLNGDGSARQTYISLFFILMRGEYDAILKFPFHFKITFCLLDQTNKNDHIIDSFQPDIHSNSFQRPRSEMNIASGIPKFAPLSIFQKENNPYIRDDIMFIKVVVDFKS